MGRSRLDKFKADNDDSDSGSDSSRSRSRSGSAKSGSPGGSPASRKSGSASPARSGTGSPARSGSRSPAKSGSASPAKSASPAGSNRSASGSQVRSRSRSKSPAESEKSATPARSQSGSPSRSRSRSKSGSQARSKSGSRARSKSGSRARSKSGSQARSQSGSQARSKSGSPSRSKTESPGPAKKDDSDSEVEAQKKRKHGSGSDSGSDVESKKKVKPGSTTPKSEASDTEKVGAEDLFGDDLSDSSEDESEKKTNKVARDDSDGDDVQRYDDDDSNRKKGLDSDSDDEIQKAAKANKASKPYDDKPEEEQIPETRIDVEVPKINTDLGREIHFVKLPNFLSVESRPFDHDTYEDEMDEDQNQQDEEGRTRLKLKVENTIRWRQGFDKEGNSIKESNSRIVKWSDGSYSLHLGSEIFDVHKQPLQSDFNHLFIRQGTGLQGQAVFKTKLSFRPHSTDSQTHKKMTLSMADRSSKSNQIKVISQVGVDPEANRWERMKKEEQGLRDAMRKDASKKRVQMIFRFIFYMPV